MKTQQDVSKVKIGDKVYTKGRHSGGYCIYTVTRLMKNYFEAVQDGYEKPTSFNYSGRLRGSSGFYLTIAYPLTQEVKESISLHVSRKKVLFLVSEIAETIRNKNEKLSKEVCNDLLEKLKAFNSTIELLD